MFARVFRGTWASAKQGEGGKYLRLDKLLPLKREEKIVWFRCTLCLNFLSRIAVSRFL